ncbi:PQQ-binding-like beta-propeller repeat protein, partial [Candidatus Poribacteria bacterium]|nr:PQQ-binding-like beta-propeller repeat protein [Candidatus Poribacteria bacterium]
QYAVTAIEISGDGNTLATGDADGTVFIWDANTMQHFSFIDTMTETVSLGLNERGDIVATLTDKRIAVWDAKTGKIKTRKNKDFLLDESYTSLDLDLTGDILTTGDENNETIVWAALSAKRIHTLVGHNKPANNVAFSSDGNRLTSGHKDGSIHIWDPKTGKRIHVLKGEMTAVNKIAFSPDDNIIAGGCDDGTIHLWFVDTGEFFKVLRGHTRKITALAFSPDLRTLASGSLDGNLHIWDITSGKTRHTYNEHLGNFTMLDITRNGKTILAHSKGGVVSIWDTETGKTRKVHSDKALKDLLDIAIHPNGHTFAIGSTDNTISIWDTETGEKVNVYAGHTTPVNNVVYSSEGKFIVSASTDGKIHLWNADTTELNRIIDTNLVRIFYLSYSPDSKTIALIGLVGDDINAFLWNVETGELKHILRHERQKLEGLPERPVEFKHINWLSNINISADSKMVVTAAASYVYLWDLATGELKKQLKLINPANSSVSFTPNPNVIAVGDTFGIITLVDTTTGFGTELLGHKDGISSVSIASTGDTIVSRSSDGVIILWNDNQ